MKFVCIWQNGFIRIQFRFIPTSFKFIYPPKLEMTEDVKNLAVYFSLVRSEGAVNWFSVAGNAFQTHVKDWLIVYWILFIRSKVMNMSVVEINEWMSGRNRWSLMHWLSGGGIIGWIVETGESHNTQSEVELTQATDAGRERKKQKRTNTSKSKWSTQLSNQHKRKCKDY